MFIDQIRTRTTRNTPPIYCPFSQPFTRVLQSWSPAIYGHFRFGRLAFSDARMPAVFAIVKSRCLIYVTTYILCLIRENSRELLTRATEDTKIAAQRALAELIRWTDVRRTEWIEINKTATHARTIKKYINTPAYIVFYVRIHAGKSILCVPLIRAPYV